MTAAALVAARIPSPLPPLLVAAAYAAAVGAAVPEMLTLQTAHEVLVAAAPLAMLAIGQTFVLLVGEIDLSVPAAMGLASVLAAALVTVGGPLGGSGFAAPAGALALVGFCTLAAVLAGACSVRLAMPSFLVSLATGMFMAGAALWFVAGIAGAASIGDLPPGLVALGYGAPAGVPLAPLAALALALGAHALLGHSLLGRWMQAVGAGRAVAEAAGVPVGRVIVAAFALAGLCAGLAAVVLVARLETGTPLLADRSLLLDIVGAAVIGGVSLAGGRARIGGVLAGVLLLAVLDKGLQLLGQSLDVVLIVKGAVILAAAAADRWRRDRPAAAPGAPR